MTEPAHGAPDPSADDREALPPDPAAYDDPRAGIARAKGLDQPYIAGGRDPDLEAARQEERRLLRILVIFALVIVLAGFFFGALNLILAGLG